MKRSMTQYERMEAGLIYDPMDAEIMREQSGYAERQWAFNQLRPTDSEGKQAYMRGVFAACGKNCYIEQPLRANWGGHHLHLGDNVYINFNFTIVDDGPIYLGDYVMVGPNVTIATANHPIEEALRRRALQYVKPVRVGANVWIGAQTVIVPGVTIGEGSVIGAGSVVTRDIPPHVVAYGNPCRVIRAIGERDRETFYKGERVDWENLKDE